MTDKSHPITPPPELVKQWLAEPEYVSGWNGKCMLLSITDHRFNNICAKAAQHGADQELEACCEHLKRIWSPSDTIDSLRAARRPKPSSLKAGAIEVLDELDGLFELPAGHYNTILRALEQLDDSL